LRRLAERLELDSAAIGPEPDWPPGDESEAPEPTHVPVAAITGTNGKSTTTRLLARIATAAGRTPGVTTSDGVWVGGQMVLAGDYTGPQGAARVLSEPGVDLGVLEVARGGLLLEGLGLPAIDIGVVTNVAADHLGLDGVETVEELALVKGTIVRAVRQLGTCVLNGADPATPALMELARPLTGICLFAIEPDRPLVEEHLVLGGWAVLVRDGWIVIERFLETVELLPVAEVPVTLGGVARHNLENALAAVAAADALGLPDAAIRAGLTAFRPTPADNPGRLNVFRRDGRTVIVDFAHNAHGLTALLDVAESLARPSGGRVWVVIGTAGDRRDEDIRALGELAARRGAGIVVKKTERYLRGRLLEELVGHYLEGIAAGGGDSATVPVTESEVAGTRVALERSAPGDVICVMCQEQREELWAMLG
jgi:cyanophycin synthetase